MREKNKDTSNDEVIWMKGMKDMVEINKKELKFPEVIILERDIKQKKKQEEYYNANKMLLELDVMKS
jgi:hypothetical protein